MTMNVEMETDEYLAWQKYRRAKRLMKTNNGKVLDIKKVTASIEDPAIIAKIKFLHEKNAAARYGAEQLFLSARTYHEDIWNTIRAELPEHFIDKEERDDDGIFKLDSGMSYNHNLNVLHYIIAEYVDEVEADEVSFSANLSLPEATDDSDTTS